MLRRLENWTPVSVGSISMGQEVGVTPMQLITAMSVMANGGLVVRPHAVRAQRRGAVLSESLQPPPRRVIRETTAATMRQMLEGVVLNGTGKNARLDGYTSAGKTGTAQKFDIATGHYSTHQLIASFVGFAPINTPAVTILVELDSAEGAHEGGQIAAPVFQRVAQQVLAYLNMPHDIPIAADTLRASRQKAAIGRRLTFPTSIRCRRSASVAPEDSLPQSNSPDAWIGRAHRGTCGRGWHPGPPICKGGRCGK
jgi:cell division protein FtsI (penicillin-binding protein 3)